MDFIVIAKTPNVKKTIEDLLYYFFQHEKYDFNQSILTNPDPNNFLFLHQIVNCPAFRQSQQITVFLEIVDEPDLELIRQFISKYNSNKHTKKTISNLIIIFNNNELSYQFDRLIEKFDEAQIEVSILSTKTCRKDCRLIECLLKELRKIFTGSSRIYID